MTPPDPPHTDAFASTIRHLADRLDALLVRQAQAPRRRMLVALAGVPGSGKSSVSRSLLAELAARGVRGGDVVVVPMDGFHYSREVLAGFEDAGEAVRRRGAPFTFDAEGCVGLVRRLWEMQVTVGVEKEEVVWAPSFDHAVKDPVLDDIAISSRVRVVIVEGNYTLLDREPWNGIAEMCHEKWFVNAPVEVVRHRLAQRHLAAGIETSLAAAVHRAEENDIPNGELIRSLLIQPDFTIDN